MGVCGPQLLQRLTTTNHDEPLTKVGGFVMLLRSCLGGQLSSLGQLA